MLSKAVAARPRVRACNAPSWISSHNYSQKLQVVLADAINQHIFNIVADVDQSRCNVGGMRSQASPGSDTCAS